MLNRPEWLSKYRNLIYSRKPEITSYDHNAYNYRYDTVGRESSCVAYRSAIIYIQLSPNLNISIIELILKETEKHLFNECDGSYGAYHLLFLNDGNEKLMHLKRPIHRWLNAKIQIEKFLKQHSVNNYQYSKCLEQLFPMMDLYSMERYPSKDDLCLVFTDNEGIDFGAQIKENLLARSNRLIAIKAQDEITVQVELLK